MSAQTLLAIDYGSKRVGLAIGNTITMTSQPLPPIVNRKMASHEAELDWLKLHAVIKEWGIKKLVLGQPLNGDGGATPMSAKIKKLGAAMGEKTGLPVVYADERYSSSEADRVLRSTLQAGKKLSKRKLAMRDSLAAQLIMQAYFKHPETDDTE